MKSRFSGMRVAVLLAAGLLLASMPYIPPVLSPDAPAILIDTDLAHTDRGCQAAQSSANAIAHALGFSRADASCSRAFRVFQFSLGRPAIAPGVPVVPGLIAYSGNEGQDSGAPRFFWNAQIASDVPFVAATGSVVGYVKIDALLIAMEPWNSVGLAFALEDAGVRRSDILSMPDNDRKMFVRVRPLTLSQIDKIVRIANGLQTRPYWAPGFVSDCASVSAGLGALAVVRARQHARVMAQAAGVQMRQVVGVVDSGADVTDAFCGAPKDASLQQLVKLALNGPQPSGGGLTLQLYATVKRSLSVAWKLNLPPNAPGRSWRMSSGPDDVRFLDMARPPFMADGLRASGLALVPHVVVPDRVRVMPPDWTLNPLRASQYADRVTDLLLGVNPLHPVVDVRAPSVEVLRSRLAEVLDFLSTITPPKGAKLSESFIFSRNDCSSAIDAAIFQATRDALAKTRGHFRFIEEGNSTRAVGPVSCTYEVNQNADALNSAIIPDGASTAEVVAGY